MPGIDEAIQAGGQLANALNEGVQVLSENQTVRFTRYVKTILPFDGYVFWVRADLLSQSALDNVSRYNSFAFNQPLITKTPAPSFDAQGSLHFSTNNQQDPDESFSINRVVFTALERVNDLNEISPLEMYIAEISDFKFAFSQRDSFYKQSNLYHYVGDAVYPVLESQIIDDANVLDMSNVIVSNSLPIWLSLNKYMPIFPSYLVPDNIRPPYAAVHINPEGTRALQAVPYIDGESNHWQLLADKVRIVIYGLRNFNALDFQDYVFAESANHNTFGLMNSPVMRDEKRAQAEISAIAMKKSFEPEISYYQVRVREIAQQLILTAIPTFTVAN